MVSIISGSNAPSIISQQISSLLCASYEHSQVLDLSDVSPTCYSSDMYRQQDPQIRKLQDQYIIGAEKWVIIMPEYNGSYPGSLKLFIDACSVRAYQKSFENKMIWFIGYGSGHGGNQRGIDHLSSAMQYLGSYIYPRSIAIGYVEDKISDHGVIDEALKRNIIDGYQGFLKFKIY